MLLLVCSSVAEAWYWSYWNGSTYVEQKTRLGGVGTIKQKILRDDAGNAMTVYDSLDGVKMSGYTLGYGWGAEGLMISNGGWFDAAMNGDR